MKRLAAGLCASALLCAALLFAVRSDAQTQGSAMPGFEGGTGWLNSAALSPADLKGKVVLVDFWEYTCINCLHTLPYLREWYKRYHDLGFTIVGVQTPEFTFSGERDNVAAAVKRLGVTWPVVLDANHVIWDRYHNTVWPHELLYDQNGKLIESVEGEGNYQVTEKNIQTALKLQNPKLKLPPLMALLPQDSYTKPGSVCYPQTAEILTGPDHMRPSNANAFDDPATDSNYVDSGGPYPDGQVFLRGFWHDSPQALVSGGPGGYFRLTYHAIQVDVVMKLENGGSMRVTVTQDGKPVAREDAGSDVRYDAKGNSYVQVDAPRAYDVIDNKHFGTHDLQVWPDGIGLGIYDVAFESCEVGADK